MMKRLFLVIGLVAAVTLMGCSPPRVPGVYRIDIQQGNVVTQEMLDKLEPNMEKRKVRFVLGTPLLVDPFNPDRWDYMYTFQPGWGDRVQRRISVLFENERLARIEGNLRPSRDRRPTRRRTETVVTVPDPEDEGFFGSLAKPFLTTGPAPSEEQERTTEEASTPEQRPGEDRRTREDQEDGEEASEPEEEDGGFFSRLARRLRGGDPDDGDGNSPTDEEAPRTGAPERQQTP